MPVPFLSIIIPALNEAAGISAQLDALHAVREQGVELILADGGSSDDTVAQARDRVDRIVVSGRGRAVQMNAGAARARGTTLLFLHADTHLPDAAVAAIHQAIDAGALWGRFDVRIAGAHPLLRVVEQMMNWRSRLTGIATGDQAIFVRHDRFIAIGGYPELSLMEDVALTTKLKRVGAPACLNERVLTSGRRWEEKGVLRTIILMWRLRAAFFFGAHPDKLSRRYGYRPPQR